MDFRSEHFAYIISRQDYVDLPLAAYVVKRSSSSNLAILLLSDAFHLVTVVGEKTNLSKVLSIHQIYFRSQGLHHFNGQLHTF
jgi:hypothetical protein